MICKSMQKRNSNENTAYYKRSEKLKLLWNATTKIRRLMITCCRIMRYTLLLVHLVDCSVYHRKTKPSSAVKNISALWKHNSVLKPIVASIHAVSEIFAVSDGSNNVHNDRKHANRNKMNNHRLRARRFHLTRHLISDLEKTFSCHLKLPCENVTLFPNPSYSEKILLYRMEVITYSGDRKYANRDKE